MHSWEEKMSSKHLKSKPSSGKCPACHGSGVIVIEDPAFPEKRQPPVCPRCRGSGRLVEGRSMVADLWDGFKSTNGPK
jgi:DnaJ-class molecular chaperone